MTKAEATAALGALGGSQTVAIRALAASPRLSARQYGRPSSEAVHDTAGHYERGTPMSKAHAISGRSTSPRGTGFCLRGGSVEKLPRLPKHWTWQGVQYHRYWSDDRDRVAGFPPHIGRIYFARDTRWPALVPDMVTTSTAAMVRDANDCEAKS